MPGPRAEHLDALQLAILSKCFHSGMRGSSPLDSCGREEAEAKAAVRRRVRAAATASTSCNAAADLDAARILFSSLFSSSFVAVSCALQIATSCSYSPNQSGGRGSGKGKPSPGLGVGRTEFAPIRAHEKTVLRRPVDRSAAATGAGRAAARSEEGMSAPVMRLLGLGRSRFAKAECFSAS